jgi:hypothetical protein
MALSQPGLEGHRIVAGQPVDLLTHECQERGVGPWIDDKYWTQDSSSDLGA